MNTVVEEAVAIVPTKRGRVSLPKAVKIVGRIAYGNGAGTRHGYMRIMADAQQDYEYWRKQGFKGTWWLRYFKGQQDD